MKNSEALNLWNQRLTRGIILTSFILASTFFTLINQNSLTSSLLFSHKSNNIAGNQLFDQFFNEIDDRKFDSNDEESIFWDLDDGDIINYNPVVLFVNHYYWDSLSFYDENKEYIFEMYANSSVIFDSSYLYSEYNNFYWELGYDWNISEYSIGTNLNITAFFYQESNPNLNHTASISVTISTLIETPTIDFEDFIIDLFHFPGSYYTVGPYYYTPTGVNPYYHFAIYPDGYVEFKFGERDLYYSDDLSEQDATELIQQLINLKFFQLKETYFAPSYDYLYHSYYDIYIQSKSVQESRSAYESKDYTIKPDQYMECLQAIKDKVDSIYFEPKRWKWELFLIIGGSSLGGIGCIAFALYVFFGYKRRR